MRISCLQYTEDVNALTDVFGACQQYQNLPMEGSNSQPLQAA